MNKLLLKRILLIAGLTKSSLFSFGQTALPYYTGFDNTAEKAGWTQFRKGVSSPYDWQTGVSIKAVSAPNTLSHDYPVGGTDSTVDWYVSPPFSFPAGGKVDSFRVNVYAINGHSAPSDSLVIYLLKGSNDPGLATKVKLADLTKMAIDNDVMKDTGNFAIPPVSGTAYIAFKYQAKGDWFVPAIDNLHISGMHTASANAQAITDEIIISPNPARSVVYVNIEKSSLPVEITIYDINGHEVNCKKDGLTEACISVDISGMQPGLYFIEIKQNNKKIVNKLTVLK